MGDIRIVLISSGGAAGKTDTNPAYHDWVSYTHTGTNTSPYPQDFYAANGNTLPNAPGCTPPSGTTANDPVMLTFRVRVPSNAKSFSLKLNFISKEFPEYVCTQFNDTFVILLDSTWVDEPANPTDKNLAFYTNPTTMERTPVGVNLAHDNTGLYTMCVNGTGGCSGISFCVCTENFDCCCVNSSRSLGGCGLGAPASIGRGAMPSSGLDTGLENTSLGRTRLSLSPPPVLAACARYCAWY